MLSAGRHLTSSAECHLILFCASHHSKPLVFKSFLIYSSYVSLGCSWGSYQSTFPGHGPWSMRCGWPHQRRRPCLITFSKLHRPLLLLLIILSSLFRQNLDKYLRNIKLWGNLKLVDIPPFNKVKDPLLEEKCRRISPKSVIFERLIQKQMNA